MENMIWTDF